MRDDEENLTKPTPTAAIARIDLSPMGIEALRAYISALRAEIERAEAAIAQKDAARGHADSFFKPGR